LYIKYEPEMKKTFFVLFLSSAVLISCGQSLSTVPFPDNFPAVTDHTKGLQLKPVLPSSGVVFKYTGPSEINLSSTTEMTLSGGFQIKTGVPGTMLTPVRWWKLSRHGATGGKATGNPAGAIKNLQEGVYYYRCTQKKDADKDTVFYADFKVVVRPSSKTVYVSAGNDSIVYKDAESQYLVSNQWFTPPPQTFMLDGTGSKGATSYKWTKTSAPAGDESTITHPYAAFTEVKNIKEGKYEFTLTINGTLSKKVKREFLSLQTAYMAPGCRTGDPVVHIIPPSSGPSMGANGQTYAKWKYPELAKWIFENTGKTLMGGDHIALKTEYSPGLPIDSVADVILDGFAGRPECRVKIRTLTKAPMIIKGSLAAFQFGTTSLTRSCSYFDVDGTYWRKSGTPWGFFLDNRWFVKTYPDFRKQRADGSYYSATTANTYFGFATNFSFKGFKAIGTGGIKMKWEGEMRPPKQLRSWTWDSVAFEDIWISNVNNEAFYIGSTDASGTKDIEEYTPAPRGKNITFKNIISDNSTWDNLQIASVNSGVVMENLFIWRAARENKSTQRAGLMFGGGSNGKILNSVFKDTRSSAMEILGHGGFDYNEIGGNVIDSFNTGENKNPSAIYVKSGFQYPEYFPHNRVNVHDNVITLKDRQLGLNLAYVSPYKLNPSLVNDNLFVHPTASIVSYSGYNAQPVAIGYSRTNSPFSGNGGAYIRNFKWTVIDVVDNALTGYKIKGTINGVYKEWTSISKWNADLRAAAGKEIQYPPLNVTTLR